ncbi:MAG TPA: type II toxin-antitoxin system RelE/ParE family toxin [Pirellulales bacterium]|nr:type II toxin-antitoxin system RelE/ParE family toxin [Pirellulales bacterium]
MATIDVTPEAREQFDALPKTIKRRVERLVERLERWPEVSGVKALSGNLAGRYRARIGDYRLQFQAERPPGENDWLLTVEKIGHLDGFYDDD